MALDELESSWSAIAARYLPISPSESEIWRYSFQPRSAALPRQGWKVHLSATILSAEETLRRVGPLLQDEHILFKGPSSMKLLSLLNSGLQFGFTQVGKAFTLYPAGDSEAVALATRLAEVLRDIAGPQIPFERRLAPDLPIFYRYGVLIATDRPDEICDPDGNWLPDLRTSAAACPPWITDPFTPSWPAEPQAVADDEGIPPIAAYAVLSQRGKGGVYEALDLRNQPARRCVLKEGRRLGEVDVSGKDGCDLVEAEQLALKSLHAGGVRVPKLHLTYAMSNNCYSVLEKIDGSSLAAVIAEAEYSSRYALQIARETAKELWALHRAGWIWRDCKPANMIWDPDSRVVLLDFEGACRQRRPSIGPYGSPGYIPPWISPLQVASQKDDIYALGITLYQTFGGVLDMVTGVPRLAGRPHLTQAPTDELINRMLSPDPAQRPDISEVTSALLHD